MTTQLIHINDVQIEQIIYQGEPVVTFAQIAEVHEVPVFNVQRSFERHAERCTPGKHYFRLDFAEANQLQLRVVVGANALIVFTLKGYLLLTKPMRDAKSWQVQERMVDEYFALLATPALLAAPALPQLHDPTAQALMQLLVEHDATKHQLLVIQAEQHRQDQQLIAQHEETIAALSTSQHAEGKADLLLDRHRMTVEQFVGIQGLLRQIPRHTWTHEVAPWLKAYSLANGFDSPALPVQGRPWKTEQSYPVEVLCRYVEYLSRRPQQIALAPAEGTR